MTDAPTMDQVMLRLEREIHRGGWDQPPQLRSIQRRGAHRLALSNPHPIPWDGETGAILAGVADQMEQETLWGRLLATATARLPGWTGFLFAYEAWTNNITPKERGGRKLADIPGSKELRGVFAVDITGGVHSVMRHRGEPAKAEGLPNLAGRIPDAMIRMVKAVAAYLPDDSGVDRKALAALRVLTDDEIEQLRVKAEAEKAAQ